MGAEQSSHNATSKIGRRNPKRSQSASSNKESGHRGSGNLANSSPRPSICSDSDIPYISYATAKPILEDSSDRKFKWMDSKPRTREKQINRESRDNKAKSVGSLVVVNAASEAPTVEKDVLCRRLTEIPSFSPIIRGSLKIPWTKDPEISEKIDATPLVRIAHLYEERLRCHAELVAAKQSKLMTSIHEVESRLDENMRVYSERQKKYTKISDKLSKVTDLSHSLSKCHCVLNETLACVETLNNMLPPDDRLEPFVWTTG